MDRARRDALARSARGVRQVAALSNDPDFEYALIDGTTVKVHRRGAGAKGAIGRSRGGLTTKNRRACRCAGQCGAFRLLSGQRHDGVGVEPLIQGVDFGALLADKAFDNDALRAALKDRGAVAFIPAKADPKAPIPHDAEMYQWRRLVENFFERIKEFRRVATRYDKTDASFATAIYLVGAFLALNGMSTFPSGAKAKLSASTLIWRFGPTPAGPCPVVQAGDRS